jgi:hypothetical protein
MNSAFADFIWADFFRRSIPIEFAWFWSGQKGVFSHETALMLHDLSGVLPHEKHMTVPAAWAYLRLQRPAWPI